MTTIKVCAVLVAHPGKAEALYELLTGLVAPSRAEEGSRQYELWRDQADPARFFLDELYTDQDAVEAHRASPHFQHYLSRIGELAQRTAWTLDPVDTGPARP